jgi:hypothetical protein
MIGDRLGIENTRAVYLDYSKGADRWQEVIAQDTTVIRQLAEQNLSEIQTLTGKAIFKHFGWLRHILYALYRLSPRPFLRESDALAEAMNSPKVDKKTMALLQRGYTLSHLAGCTAAVYHHLDLGMLHIRCLDWDMSPKEIAAATRIFEFKKGEEIVFRAVGIAGMVGVLSGVKPGKFSVTINWASSKDAWLPWLKPEPTLRLRDVFERCETYDGAVAALSRRELSTPVFFTVCGSKPGQACVIEVAHKGLLNQEINKREFNFAEGFLVQTNHYDEDGPLAKQNKYDPSKRPFGNPSTIDLEKTSGARRRAMIGILKQLIAGESQGLDAVAEDTLSQSPVQNRFTVQQMVMVPKTGQLRVWAGSDTGS